MDNKNSNNPLDSLAQALLKLIPELPEVIRNKDSHNKFNQKNPEK